MRFVPFSTEPDCSKCSHVIACIALRRKPTIVVVSGRGGPTESWHGCTEGEERAYVSKKWGHLGANMVNLEYAPDTPQCDKEAMVRL